jgi:hypothetical protein
MSQISNKLSRKIVQFLKDEKKLDEKQIAKLAGTTPKFITEIVDGDKAFKQSQMDKIQKEYELFLAMAPGLVSELIAAKTKTSREFVKEKTKQGKTMLKKSTNSLMQFICNLAAEHSDKS